MTDYIYFRPMLAAPIEMDDLDHLHYPVFVQPKLDGIRCVVINGEALSRTLKPIQNASIKRRIEQYCKLFLPQYFLVDGEIVSGKTFQECTSAVMSEEGTPDFDYVIFDCIKKQDERSVSYMKRFYENEEISLLNARITTKIASDKATVISHELLWVNESGFEGIIIRSLLAQYKYNRSTLKQEYLLKLKRFLDSEATIIGFREYMANLSESQPNALGYLESSSAKENLIGEDKLGALIVRDIKTGKEFDVGSGFTDSQRRMIWNNRIAFKGRIIKYKYQSYGVKDLPRSPIFLGLMK